MVIVPVFNGVGRQQTLRYPTTFGHATVTGDRYAGMIFVTRTGCPLA
jgi:hypothetical protein